MDWSDKPALPELATNRTIGGFRRGVVTAAPPDSCSSGRA